MRIELIFLPLLAVIFQFTTAERSREIYEYDECRAAYQEPLGVSSGRIPDSAFWSTDSNKKRPPHAARLGDSSGAWTAGTQNSQQFLGVDLGDRYIVTSVATQGRRGSDEYVTEYFLEFSDDKNTWRIYTNEYGIPEMFTGNDNGFQERKNTLRYPITARYVRFNPQRWNMFISLRVEIYGCLFKPYVASFGGSGFLKYDISQQAVQSESDKLELRFKTNRADGVLFYASGNQGDFIMLEMRRGFLYFKQDLGSTQLSRGRTVVVGGSLLDDHNWHDVVIRRQKHELTVVVDRLVNEVRTEGLFYRLDLDKFIYIGGVPYFTLDGIEVKYNFIGCIENVDFNGGKLLVDAHLGESPMITREGTVGFNCGISSDIPISFPSSESQLIVPGSSTEPIRVAFEFRTHDTNGLLVYHPCNAVGSYVSVQLDENGFISYKIVSTSFQVIEDVVRNTDVLSTTRSFTDGLWHSFSLHIDRTKVNCTVDRNVKVSNRVLDIQSGNTYYIGAYKLNTGFLGCIRNLEVSARKVEIEELSSDAIVKATIGTCGIRDRCTPNPCEHGGFCFQDWNNFYCRCDGTGYKGAMCHISAYPVSCAMFKLYSNIEGMEEAIIDPDGSGPLKPFPVKCETADGKTITYISHDSQNLITVNGYQEPGSYIRMLNYVTDLPELTDVIERAQSCQQYIEYICNNSRLLLPLTANSNNQDNTININTPVISNLPRSYGWWVGRTYQPMYYWGGAAPGSGKCLCGLQEKGCESGSTTCNCDAGLETEKSDKGYLVHKDYLPVIELHFGDTGSVTDRKVAHHRVGELECTGDDLFDNVVTFRKADATIEFATFEADNAGDIWFQFRTTTSDGIMIHNTGPVDFIEVRLFQMDTIQFRYNVGNGVVVLSYKSPGPLNDDTWHTVHVEHNRKQAWMRIDDQPEKITNEDSDLIRMLDLTSRLVVGSSVGNTDGYVGCIRGLRVNGRLLDLKGMVERGEVTYGVSVGCVGKCMSNPCFNGGTCQEGYSGYECDCSYTPFRGWMCGREVGINLQTSFQVKYEFDDIQGLSASDFQFARVGFSTKLKQGILLQLRNEENTEYISVEVNNNGGVRVAIDVGFQREEVNTPNQGIDYCNGQQHEVIVRRSNKGKKITVQVDNYAPGVKTFDISDSSDTILDNPKYLFIGNNDTTETSRGFEGCIFRVQVDNIFPLKRAFQDPRPDFIRLFPPGKVKEDMCGFEEVTQPGDPFESRPKGGDYINVTYPYVPQEGMTTEERAILGAILAFVFILAIVFIVFLCRRRDKGDYDTQEAKFADVADNQDTAVMYNETGVGEVTKRQEWFM
ncbi:neurexin-4 [Patella vulgata]|uniref:neurexin-4 n=1 Tax=Patella vulgata TaxID=6465 RepID=UPI00217FAEC4|nr:neurexin-4 [Patella vulgata]